ncbi:MAG: class I SAM-dependent methyltransferase [Anaerolineales bacterium]|jgi:ubiquinone/menaquinone biosynthesis C-methylase UbiE
MQKDRPPVCDYEGSDYQTRFWENADRVYEDRVEAVALRRLLPAEGNLLLEVGAGAGRNTPRYSGFQRIVLLDYSYSQLQQARRRLGDSSRYCYVAGDVYHLPFAESVFDGATMIRTLHHMADPFAALRQIRVALKPQSVFVLEYANKRNIKAIIRWLLRRQSWSPFDPEPVEFAELNFDFHPKTVRKWLDEAGFKLERQLSVSHFRIAILKRLAPLDLLVTLDSALQWTGACWQLSPSMFVRCRSIAESQKSVRENFWKCPACESNDMQSNDEGIRCAACGRMWAIRDGIFDFREPLG